MDKFESQDNAEALALLGLRAGGASSAPVGEPPTVEEFTALYEGGLDATRRAQILSHIAADQAIYGAWLEVVSAQATLDERPLKAPEFEADRPTLKQDIANWFSSLFRRPAMAGGFAAAALMAVLLLPGQQDADSVGALYSDFGSDWQVAPASLQDRVIRNTRKARRVDPAQQAIYLGLQDGLGELGDGFSAAWLRPVQVDGGAESLPPALRTTLENMGKLAVLARFKCQLEGSEAFFRAAEQALDELRPGLEAGQSKSGGYLARVIDQPGTPKERTCAFSTAAVAVLDR